METVEVSIASVDVSSVVRSCDVTSVDAGYTLIKRTTSHQSLCVVLNYLRARDSLTVRDSLISDLCLVRESQTECDSLSVRDNLTSNQRVYVIISLLVTILSQAYAL